MKIEIWSDIVCPFCYIGKRKLERALEKYPGKDDVEIEWKSFQLDPEMDNKEGLNVHEYLGKRKGGTTADGKAMNDHMANVAKQVGLEYNFYQVIINNTLPAHRLLHFAKEKGKQNELQERLFRAYYTEGKDTADFETLVQLATEIGIDGNESRAVLEENQFLEEVRADQLQANNIGVQGVPFFVFNNKYAVSGAQPPEVFTEVLEKAKAEEKPMVMMQGNQDGTCDINGNCN